MLIYFTTTQKCQTCIVAKRKLLIYQWYFRWKMYRNGQHAVRRPYGVRTIFSADLRNTKINWINCITKKIFKEYWFTFACGSRQFKFLKCVYGKKLLVPVLVHHSLQSKQIKRKVSLVYSLKIKILKELHIWKSFLYLSQLSFRHCSIILGPFWWATWGCSWRQPRYN